MIENLSEKVRELRSKNGLTQEELARQMCVTLSTIQRWELKGGKPSHLACRELRKYFRKAAID